jgi:CBS domain containing-hemolysin-like protein
MLIFVLSVATALVFSFVCSLAEATLLSVTFARVEALANQGSRAGRLLKRFKQQPDIPIAAILVLNTIANTAGAVVSTHMFDTVFPGVNPAWFAASFTIAILLFTEIAPKTLGVVYANALAVPITYMVQVMVQLLQPVLLVTRLVSRMVGAGRHHVPTTSLEEIRVLAAAGQDQGLFGSLTAGIIHNATRLRERRAGDVMVPRGRVVYLSGQNSVEQNLAITRRTGHSRFPYSPTGELDKVVGTVLAKELLFHLRDNPEPDWDDLLVPLLVVPETAALNHVLRAFQREKRHMAIVVDEYGGVQGIVTLEDVLEEIVGEIEDEHHAEETHLLQRADGSLLCRGIAEVAKVFAKLGLDQVQTSSKTLSGFLAEQLGELPQAGAELRYGGYRFTVTKANNRRAERVRVDRIAEPAAGS